MSYTEDTGNITFAFAGDTMPARRLRAHNEPDFRSLVGLLRSADVTVTNSETLYHRYEGTPVPDAGPYGTYAACPPETIADLKWMGIDMVSTANNHCVDYGETGLVANLENLERYGLAHAGTGRSLTEAVRPRYLQTARGTVALVAVTLTLPPGDHRAGEPRGAVRARAGANVLRHTTAHQVPRAAFDALVELGGALRLGRGFRRTGDTVELLGRSFTLGDGYATRQTLDEHDLRLNLRWIEEAGQLADWVVVSLHNHESGAGRDLPSDAAVDFAHRAVEAGADVVFGHGPHLDRGIEIHRGRPIFYALGNFVLQNEVIPQQPWDFARRLGLPPEATTGELYRERGARGKGGLAQDPVGLRSAVATVGFRGHELTEIRLHPVDLGIGTSERRRAGRPLLASGAVAADVVERFRRLSAPYGTTVTAAEGPRTTGLVELSRLPERPGLPAVPVAGS